jgi:hypothetical protein
MICVIPIGCVFNIITIAIIFKGRLFLDIIRSITHPPICLNQRNLRLRNIAEVVDLLLNLRVKDDVKAHHVVVIVDGTLLSFFV